MNYKKFSKSYYKERNLSKISFSLRNNNVIASALLAIR